jgi:hypothetical protein
MIRSTVVALLLTMAACGGEGTPTATVATSTTAPAATTSTVALVTTRPAPAPACPTTPLTATATGVTTAAGSFDGDGQPDLLKAYQAAGTWHLRLELTAGGGVDVTVPNVGSVDSVKALGGFNVDAGAADEAFASVGSGSYTTMVGIWKVVGSCQLTRLTVNGQPSSFPVGASVRNRAGLRCVAGTAVQALESESSDGIKYTGTITNYDVMGNTLVLANTSPPQVIADGDPALRAYGALTCGSLKLS